MKSEIVGLRFAAMTAALVVLVSCRSSSAPYQDSIGPWDVQRPPAVSRSALEFRLVLDEAEPGSIELPAPEGGTLVLSPTAVATQGDIVKTAIIQSVNLPYFAVYVYFSTDAAQRMQEVSAVHVGRRIAIVMDGRVFMAPFMHGRFDSPVMIDGSYTREEAIRIAQRLAP